MLHPALPTDPGHKLWKRDFTGASGLFGLVLKPLSSKQMSCFFAHLEIFGIGLSWGGYESLALPVDTPPRTLRKCNPEESLVRIHAGLENVDDLIEDVTHALNRALCA